MDELRDLIRLLDNSQMPDSAMPKVSLGELRALRAALAARSELGAEGLRDLLSQASNRLDLYQTHDEDCPRPIAGAQCPCSHGRLMREIDIALAATPAADSRTGYLPGMTHGTGGNTLTPAADSRGSAIDPEKLARALSAAYQSNLGQMESDTWDEMAETIAREYAALESES